MMTVLSSTRSQLSSMAEEELASYRYAIFVETLQWQLPAENGREFDQFDRPDTRYVIARDAQGLICGCARLLPTTRAYLLDEVFPGLMNGQPAPHDAQVWELSRFSTKGTGELNPPSREAARARFCTLFAAVVEAAMAQGATRLITFTAMGVERILRSIGMHAHRVGPPQMIDDKPVLAMWIDLDEQTCNALGLRWQTSRELLH
jgi:acyl homoserine lactone synthase